METATILSNIRIIADLHNLNVRLNVLEKIKKNIQDLENYICVRTGHLDIGLNKMLNGPHHMYWLYENEVKFFKHEIAHSVAKLQIQYELLNEYSPIISTS